MTGATTKKFMALYLAPATVLADWAKTDPEVRKAAEQKMQAEWTKWMGDHAKMITVTEAGGKTKRVAASGISDTKNDIRSSRRTRTRLPRSCSRIIHTFRFHNRRLK
jgi:hypothetical protein